MKAILVNYEYTPDWLLKPEYADIDYLISDRSESKDWLKDFPQERIRYSKNIGNVDYDKLSYLVEHYDNLPDVFLWGKTNLFKYISKEEFEKVRHNKEFTPLLTMEHRTYSDRISKVCYYQGGIYHERNDSWYFNELPHNFNSYAEFAREFNLSSPMYLPFAPGGNYILTKERVHRYGRHFYERLRDALPYCQNPAEAHALERSYYSIWK